MRFALPILAVLLLCACGVAVTSSASHSAGAKVKNISAEKAKAMMEDGSADLILDVRTAEEFASGHVPGAVNLPLDEIDRFSELYPEKDAVLLLYCRSGNRSGQAAKYLVDNGYTNVSNFGGIIDWPYDTES